ncbi:uncharacterized protein LOC132819538 [Hemiscyllium ocellatum]|uniref:uncharacterized protein LOC132819538 n=1 Tax=Hemiscyllium ocellatum TaxID=170820 RepID=UPI0029676C2B|nr:uncharacterized protein LOC132819538 [Hemiscyllium ocellatum]
MDDCTLKELSLSAGILDPAFNPSILNYRVTLGNDTANLTVYPVTSDNHATYQIIGTGGSKTVGLQDGLNKIEIEVAAEDGTLKRYKIEATKLSANTPVLSGLKIAENLTLDPPFSISEYKYTCMWVVSLMNPGSKLSFLHCRLVNDLALARLETKNENVSQQSTNLTSNLKLKLSYLPRFPHFLINCPARKSNCFLSCRLTLVFQ